MLRLGASILPCLLFSCWAECDLTPWLNEEEGADKGYHVLCVTESVKIYVNGEVGSLPNDLPINNTLVEQLETTLQLKGHLLFKKPEGRWTAWPKQSWAVFTDVGERWEPEDLVERASKYKGVLLLFEGGTWRWPSIRRGYAREVLPGLVLKTVAVKPALFDLEFSSSSQGIPKLLTDVVKTSETNLFRSITEGKVSDTRTSDQAWLSYSSTQELRDLHNFTVQVLRIPESYFEEKLQVLRYKLGQYYDAHRDYWDPSEFPDKQRFLHPQSRTWNMRHATLLWYLQRPEEGGETWFPRAHGGPVPWDDWTACDDRGVKMGSSSVAILFYSLYSSGDIDSFSWHCGCPVRRGTKWAANSWVWNQPQEAPPFAQRRATVGQSEL